jgi:hypothetical protein
VSLEYTIEFPIGTFTDLPIRVLQQISIRALGQGNQALCSPDGSEIEIDIGQCPECLVRLVGNLTLQGHDLLFIRSQHVGLEAQHLLHHDPVVVEFRTFQPGGDCTGIDSKDLGLDETGRGGEPCHDPVGDTLPTLVGRIAAIGSVQQECILHDPFGNLSVR